jgi:hypothetical protein
MHSERHVIKDDKEAGDAVRLQHPEATWSHSALLDSCNKSEEETILPRDNFKAAATPSLANLMLKRVIRPKVLQVGGLQVAVWPRHP